MSPEKLTRIFSPARHCDAIEFEQRALHYKEYSSLHKERSFTRILLIDAKQQMTQQIFPTLEISLFFQFNPPLNIVKK